jgi:hypothetical protein
MQDSKPYFTKSSKITNRQSRQEQQEQLLHR